MRLHVMRHGPAEDRAASGRDADRILTPEGRARVREVATELLRLRAGATPPRVLTSPLARARETAEIVAACLLGAVSDAASRLTPGDIIEVRDELSLDADLPLRLVAEVAALGTDALLVSHAPNVDHLVRALAPGPDHRPPPAVAAGFCTAMVVTLAPLDPQASPGGWQVLDVVDPRRLQ